MANHSKLPQIRQNAFLSAREGLGISAKDLAAQACLSTRQVQQLENGEQSSFYGAQVKFTAAKKVAALLGLKDEDAFDYGEPVKDSANKEKLRAEGTSSKAVDMLVPEIQKKVEVPLKTVDAQLRSLHQTAAKSKPKPRKRYVLWLGFMVAVAFLVINLRPLFFPKEAEEVLLVKDIVVESDLAAVPTEPINVTIPEAELAPPVVNPVAELKEACPAQDSEVIHYQPEAPRKRADMVYVQVKSRQVICVTDATGKNQNKTVEAGVGTSFFGQPPFKLVTGGMTQVDVYFQGTKVRLANLNTKVLVLESAELVAPTTQSDSELR